MIRRTLLCACLALAPMANAQAGNGELTGKWILTADHYGYPIYWPVELKQEGAKLFGKFLGDSLEGQRSGSTIHFVAKNGKGNSETATGNIQDGKLTGTIIFVDRNNPDHPETHTFVAIKRPAKPTTTPKTHEFVPTNFYRQYLATNQPVLKINPGDTIHTTTIDSSGIDENGVHRSLGGNPQTGPFYIESAMPGDTLVVHIKRLRLNRNWALSTDGIVPRGLDDGLAVKMKDTGEAVKWTLDLEKGLARPENPGEHLKNFVVPVKPMLGCIGAALMPHQSGTNSTDSGSHGGNMDFNEVVDGTTVYLPVRVPGAMLYFGDGHAVQGDGETTGDALETTLDVTVTVDVIHEKSVPSPRLESETHVMAMGLDGSIDGAVKQATANMGAWLMDTYQLTPSELAQVLGATAEYRISEFADRNAGVVLKINKDQLKGLDR